MQPTHVFKLLTSPAVAASLLRLTLGGCARTGRVAEGQKTMMIQKDYEALTGRWQLVKSIVDGKPVSEAGLRRTVLITDHDNLPLSR
jgi:hypothetical protein